MIIDINFFNQTHSFFKEVSKEYSDTNPQDFKGKIPISEGTELLVQVEKEERGNKGAAVTTRLSLAGKYCVLMPNTNKGGGISRKIIDIKHRKKLKDIVEEWFDSGSTHSFVLEKRKDLKWPADMYLELSLIHI